MIKIIALVIFACAVVALFTGLYFLFTEKGRQQDTKTMRTLIVRVSFAVAFMAFLVLAIAMGWITPHAVGR